VRTINVVDLRQERDRLTKRLETLNQLLGLVDSLNGIAHKKAGRPKGGKGQMSPEGRERIRQAQRLRWKKFKAQQKAAKA